MTEVVSRRRWWQFIGPWPLFPTAVALALWVTSSIFEIAQLTGTRNTENWVQVPAAFLPTLLPALVAWIFLTFVNRFFPRVSQRLWSYLLALAVLIVVYVAVRFVLGQLPSEAYGTQVRVFFAGMVRVSLTVLVIQTSVGISRMRMQRQIDQTTAALALAREQQEQLVNADERLRSQVSQLLHDRVQAGLIAACLELQELAENGGPEQADRVQPIVKRLEDLRSLDVRGAARVLSPDLADIDLHTALEELAGQYGGSMQIEIDVDEQLNQQSTRPAQPVLLGCYRIIEQALLNAAIHGKAKRCVIRVAAQGGDVVVTVTDDGIGLPAQIEPGIGTIMTTTWVRILNGSWSRSRGATGGTVVEARMRADTGPMSL